MRSFFLLLIALFVAFCASVWLYFGSFAALTAEAPVAKVAISQKAPERFVLDVHFHNGMSESYEVAGDYFLMQAEVVTLQNWATIMGAEPKIRLVRLNGNYWEVQTGTIIDCAEDGNFAKPGRCYSDHDLSGDQYQVTLGWARTSLGKLGSWVLDFTGAERTRFVSAAGVQMADGVEVWVCMTEDALVIRDAGPGCRAGGAFY